MLMRTFFVICGLFAFVACNNNAKKEDIQKEDTVKTEQDTPVKLSTDTVFTALGTEPFWAVYVIKNNKIVFHPADGQDIEVPWIEATTSDAVTRQYTSFGNGN